MLSEKNISNSLLEWQVKMSEDRTTSYLKTPQHTTPNQLLPHFFFTLHKIKSNPRKKIKKIEIGNNIK